MCMYISGRDIFCLNFDTFTRTSVRVSKMNAVARAQLTFQIFTLLQKYVYIYKHIATKQSDRSPKVVTLFLLIALVGIL